MYYRPVKNSVHIRPPYTSQDIKAFALGYDTSGVRGSVQIAWQLENAALDRGWPIGESLGSECDFIEQFSTSRDVVRGAIRLVEARGLMRMRRGCKGGLRLLRPDIDHSAGTFATYLRASGYCPAQLATVEAALAPLCPEFDCGSVVWQLLDRIGTLLSDGPPPGSIEGARAETVAMRLLLQVGTPIPEVGVRLGCEAEISEQYGLGHRTFRQTLQILDDLGMLQVKRGRAGGYWLIRPAPIGVIRRIFALLASRGMHALDAEQVIWALSITNLRLVFRRMSSLEGKERATRCDELSATRRGLTGMRRWMTFQKGLVAIADDLLLSTLTSSMQAYLARVGPLPGYDNYDRRLLDVEEAMLRALRDGRPVEAEHHLRLGQSYMSEGNGAELRAAR